MDHVEQPSLPAPAAPSPNNPWMMSTLVLVGLIVGFGIGQLPVLQRGVSEAKVATVTAPAPTPQQQAAPAAPELSPEDYQKKSDGLLDDDVVIGNPNAKIAIVEFSDFQCPFCGKFLRETFPQLEENYIKTGKAKLIYRDFPLDIHPQAQKAAEAAECAREQGKFREMHDELFVKQQEWSGNDKASDVFKQYAKSFGLKAAQFDECLDKGKYGAEVKKDLLDGLQAGVSGTPTFYVNGRELSGAQPYATFQRLLETL